MATTSQKILTLAAIVTTGFVSTCLLFDSALANSAIDSLSFFAGGFLAAEGYYKLRKFRGSSPILQVMRGMRMLMGFCIFTVHIIQFIWGLDTPVVSAPVNGAIIDWFAFFFGFFLITEGTYRIFTAKKPSAGDQSLRAFRVLIGSCVFTIHLLQFMRF